jgi:hypothetical protein
LRGQPDQNIASRNRIAVVDEDLGHDTSAGVLHDLTVLIDLDPARRDHCAEIRAETGPRANSAKQQGKADDTDHQMFAGRPEDGRRAIHMYGTLAFCRGGDVP